MYYANGRTSKQRCTACPAKQIAMLVQVLTIILSSDYVEADWKGWIEGTPSADAACQINATQIDIPNLHQLQPRHLPVLHSMHRHKAFDDNAWTGMSCTLERLAESTDGTQPVGPDAGATQHLAYACTE